MTVRISIQDKYAQALSPLGDLQQAVDTALRRYAIEEITTKIAELRQRSEAFVKKYGCDYETFKRKSARDQKFVTRVEKTISKTWELDVAEWEYCHRGVDDWTQRLQEIFIG